AGTLHVAAVSEREGELAVLKIRDETPQSPTDFLLLNLARARADAIVTTGRILREESEVTHELQGSAPNRAALREWRRELGLGAPPVLAVLTRGRDFAADHPAWSAEVRPVLFGPEGRTAEEIEATRSVAVAMPEGDGLRGVVAALRRSGCRRISIEAGPSSARGLYDPPVVVDELLLSVFHGAVPPAVVGRPFLAAGRLEAAFGAPAGRSALGPDGWEFRHYRRFRAGRGR
ncbi:MAG: hypothetical protein R3190_02905, partial [Thermoanaerobaculia bacterium]|nr:hypothetical protein [Thermoanaerobaculia bacterium]